MALSIELEEWVGSHWHRWATRAGSWQHFPDAAVSLADVRQALAVFFRMGGGDPGLSVDAISERESRHRLSLRQRLGFDSELLVQPRRDPESLFLPAQLDVLPEASLNRDLYFWLAAFFTQMPPAPALHDPLQRDVQFLRDARRASAAVLAQLPGLRSRYQRLRKQLLLLRPQRLSLPPAEAALEMAIRHSLARSGGRTEESELRTDRRHASKPLFQRVYAAVFDESLAIEGLRAPASYRPFLPLPLWGVVSDRSPEVRTALEQAEGEEEPGIESQTVAAGARKARREEQDQAERDDPLVFNRFEKMLSFSDMVNLNRMVDDDPDENASKTAEQLEEMTLSPHQRKAASRLQVELDMATDAVEEGRIGGSFTYPEWHYRRACYLPEQSRVHVELHAEAEQAWQPDDSTRRRVRRVQRQFEALRPKRVVLRAQPEGAELDTDAAVRGYCDQIATGLPSENVYLDTRPEARDLAVSVLVDNSLSTEAWLEDRRVIDVIQEAIHVLAHGLQRCGDDFAITTFTSHRRKHVWLRRIKCFDESVTARVDRRIAELRPGSYTRIGPAIRHAVAELAMRPNRFRLLLLLSDGKPNDTDYYEGRYAIEDTRRAILDARQQEVRVFGITVDKAAGQYVPRLFGRGGYALVDRPEKLSEALPRIYRQITTG